MEFFNRIGRYLPLARYVIYVPAFPYPKLASVCHSEVLPPPVVVRKYQLDGNRIGRPHSSPGPFAFGAIRCLVFEGGAQELVHVRTSILGGVGFDSDDCVRVPFRPERLLDLIVI